MCTRRLRRREKGLPERLTIVPAAKVKLVPEKGPVEFLVIDHVEKPSAN
jgi:hypothetical protein